MMNITDIKTSICLLNCAYSISLKYIVFIVQADYKIYSAKQVQTSV